MAQNEDTNKFSDPIWTWQRFWTKNKNPILTNIESWTEINGRKDIAISDPFPEDQVRDLDKCFLSELRHRTWIALVENSLPSFMRNRINEVDPYWPLVEIRELPLKFYGETEKDGKVKASMSLYCCIWQYPPEGILKEPYVVGYFIAGKYGLRVIDFEIDTFENINSDAQSRAVKKKKEITSYRETQLGNFKYLFWPFEKEKEKDDSKKQFNKASDEGKSLIEEDIEKIVETTKVNESNVSDYKRPLIAIGFTREDESPKGITKSGIKDSKSWGNPLVTLDDIKEEEQLKSIKAEFKNNVDAIWKKIDRYKAEFIKFQGNFILERNELIQFLNSIIKGPVIHNEDWFKSWLVNITDPEKKAIEELIEKYTFDSDSVRLNRSLLDTILPTLKNKLWFSWNHQIPRSLEKKYDRRIDQKRHNMSGLDLNEQNRIKAEYEKIIKPYDLSISWNHVIEDVNNRRKNNSWRLIYPEVCEKDVELSKNVREFIACKQSAYKDKLNRDSISKSEKVCISSYIRAELRESDNPLAIWMKPLPFYSEIGINLYEVIDWRFEQPRRSRFLFSAKGDFSKKDGNEDSKTYLITDEGCLFKQLDGTSIPIYEVNKYLIDNKYSINIADQSIEYLHFFCTNVAGEEGYFSLVEDFQNDIGWFMSGMRQCEDLKKLIHDNNGFSPIWPITSVLSDRPIIKALVFYGGVLFLSVFKVDEKGFIEMLDDFPLIEKLEVKPEPVPYKPDHQKYKDALESHFKILEDKLGPGQVLRKNYEGLVSRGGCRELNERS